MEELRTPEVRVLTAFCLLLRAGLWEKNLEDLSAFPMSSDRWENIYTLAKVHTVTGIVYQGICRLPDTCLPPEKIMIRWVAKVTAIEQKNERMNSAIAELFQLFQQMDCRPVLMKGQGIARFYESPLLRDCGDIDLYFADREENEEVLQKLQRMRIQINRMPDQSTWYQWRGFVVEHHICLLDMHRTDKKEYLKKLERQYGFSTLALGDEFQTDVSIPSPLMNILLLNLHILKHTLGRGIGLRQLCDLARTYYHYRHVVDWKELICIYQKIGITRWCDLLHSFLNEYIGLSVDGLRCRYPQENPRILLDKVLLHGNFGCLNSVPASGIGKEWLRKYYTFLCFIRNIRFACRYAPMEYMAIVGRLIKGDLCR